MRLPGTGGALVAGMRPRHLPSPSWRMRQSNTYITRPKAVACGSTFDGPHKLCGIKMEGACYHTPSSEN